MLLTMTRRLHRCHQDIVVLPFEANFRKVAHAQLAVARFDLLFADLTYVPDGMRRKPFGRSGAVKTESSRATGMSVW